MLHYNSIGAALSRQKLFMCIGLMCASIFGVMPGTIPLLACASWSTVIGKDRVNSTQNIHHEVLTCH